MRQRAFQQFPILEVMPEHFLQRFQVRAHFQQGNQFIERRAAWRQRA
jgi:hypothetical protein